MRKLTALQLEGLERCSDTIPTPFVGTNSFSEQSSRKRLDLKDTTADGTRIAIKHLEDNMKRLEDGMMEMRNAMKDLAGDIKE